MPSGSKKRKSSKKPKTQGGAPELEAGLDEVMANAGEEVEEATPSPKGIEEDPEAMAERGLDGNTVNGEVSQDGGTEPPKREIQKDEDQDVSGHGDPSSQAEPEPEISAGIEAEAPAVIEPEGEPAPRESEPHKNTPLLESEAKIDATPEDFRPEVQSDTVPIEPEPVADATPDASPGEIKADADVSLDEIESSERKFEVDAAELGSRSGVDESIMGAEAEIEEASRPDTEPELGKAPDEFDAAAAPAEAESEIGEPLVNMKPEGDAASLIKPENNAASDEVPVEVELEKDGAPPEIDPEAQIEELEGVATANIEPEPEEASGELMTDAAPPDVEAEAEEAPVIIDAECEEASNERKLMTDAAPRDVGAEVEEAPVIIDAECEEASNERKLMTDAAPRDVGAASEAAPVEEVETEAPAVIEPETEEAPMKRESEIDTASIDVEAEASAERELATDAVTEPENDAAPADIKAEMDTAQVDTDTLQGKAPPEIDTASPENETESDKTAQAFESEADAAVVNLEPPVEVSPVVMEPEANVSSGKTEQDETPQAIIEAAPEPPEPQTEDSEPDVHAEDVAAQEPEPEVEALVNREPEVNEEDVINSAENEAKIEPPQETEPEQKTVDFAEDTPLERPQEVQPEQEVEALGEAKPEDEASAGVTAEEKGLDENKSDQEDFVDGEAKAPPEITPEPELGTTHEIGPEMEAEVPLEAELEAVVEAPAEVESDEKGLIEAEPNQQDFVETEQDQSGVREEGQQLVCNDNQSSKSEPQGAVESEVEPPAISASDETNIMDNATSSTSSSEVFHTMDKEGIAVDQASEGEDIPPSAITLDGGRESTSKVVSEEDSGRGIEQTRVIAVDNEQGASDELPAEAKEDISEEQGRAVDVVRDEVGTFVASPGNGGVPEESASGQELATELPSAEVGDIEESVKGLTEEQERAVDVGHGKDEAVIASAENGIQAESSIEQESDMGLPQADVAHVEEFAKEGSPPSDQGPVIEQPQPPSAEQDSSMGSGAAAEVPSDESERMLDATFPSSESKMTSVEPQDEKIDLERELNIAYTSGEPERDIGEEEAVSSTVAEVGSVLNDFDERACSEQELPNESSSTDQDVDVPECKEFDGNLSMESPESIETGLREELDSESYPAEKVDANIVAGLEATSKQPEVLLESEAAAKAAEDLHSMPVEEIPSDEQVPSSPQLEQVAQDNQRDEDQPGHLEEKRTAGEDKKVATNPIMGTSLPILAGDELISKAFKYLENGQQSSEAPSNESNIQQTEANTIDKAEIHAMDSKGWKDAEQSPMKGDTNNDAVVGTPVESALPISEGRDIKDIQAFRQESTQEASLPVAINSQDRALERVDLNIAERPSGGGALKRRTKLLDCCGMFDLLLKKN